MVGVRQRHYEILRNSKLLQSFFFFKLPLLIILGAVYGEDGGDTPSSLDPDNLFRARRLAETVEAVGRSLK